MLRLCLPGGVSIKRCLFNCVLIHTLVTWSFIFHFTLHQFIDDDDVVVVVDDNECVQWCEHSRCKQPYTCTTVVSRRLIVLEGYDKWQLIWDSEWNKESCLISQEMKCSIIDTRMHPNNFSSTMNTLIMISMHLRADTSPPARACRWSIQFSPSGTMTATNSIKANHSLF